VAWRGVTWHSAQRGAVCGVRLPDGSCHIVAQCVVVWCSVRRAAGRGVECGRVVRPPDVGRHGVGQQAVFGRLTCHVTSGCGVWWCGAGCGAACSRAWMA